MQPSTHDVWTRRLKRAAEEAAEAKRALEENAAGAFCRIVVFTHVHVCTAYTHACVWDRSASQPASQPLYSSPAYYTTTTTTALSQAESAAAEVEELRTRLSEAVGEGERKGKEVERLKQVCARVCAYI